MVTSSTDAFRTATSILRDAEKAGARPHHLPCAAGRVEEFYGDPLTRLSGRWEATFGFQILIARDEIGGLLFPLPGACLQEIESVLRQRKDAEVIEKKDRTPPVKSKIGPGRTPMIHWERRPCVG